VAIDAETRVFGETVTAAADIRLNSIELPKVARFVGPLGFERRAGTVDVELNANLRIDPDGRIEGDTRGTIWLRDAELSRPEIELSLSRAEIGFDTRAVVLPDTAASGTGNVRAVLGRGEASAADAFRLAFDEASVEIAAADFAVTPQGALRMRAKPTISIDAPRLAAPLAMQGERLTLVAAEMSIDGAGGTLAIEGTGTGRLTAMQSDLPSNGAISSAGVEVRLAGLRARSGDGVFSAESIAAMEAEALRYAQPRGEAGGTLDLAIKAAKIDAPHLTIRVADEGTDLGGTAAVALADFRTSVSEAGSAAGLVLAGDGLQFDLDHLRASVRQGLSAIDGEAGLAIQALKATQRTAQTDASLEVAVGTGRIDASPFTISAAPETTKLGGTAKLTFADMRSKEAGAGGASALNVGSAVVQLPRANAVIAGDQTSVGIEGTVAVGEIGVSLQPANGLPAINAAVEAIAVTVDDATLALAGEAGPWRIAAGGELKGASAEAAGGAAGKGSIGSLSLTGLRADPAAVVLDAVTVSGLAAEFSDRTVTQFAGSKPAAPQTSDAAKSSGPAADPQPVIRVGRFTASAPSTVAFRDTSVDPAVNVAVAFRELALTSFDTGKADARSEIRLAADVNEFTKVELSGWATLLKSAPDFDLRAAVNGLELYTFSPYAAKAVGVNVEQGQLSAEAQGAGREGALTGLVKVVLEDLNMSPLSAADAKRISANVGLPIETAVGLLQDTEGRIRLNLPVSGTVGAPNVDLSEAIAKAVAGAMAAVFPPTAIASLLSSAGGSRLEFNPVVFPPGSAELGDDGRAHADKVVRLLRERPKLSLAVCGIATAPDLEALQAGKSPPGSPPSPAATGPGATPTGPAAQPAPAPAAADPGAAAKDISDVLAQLAVERTRSVRRYLIEEKKLAAKRVRGCRPRFDARDSGPPRVEMSL
jgi:hypothetical protein